MGEFDLIARYFERNKRSDRDDILQNIGDDCAVTALKPNSHLAVTTDTLVVGTHFLADISPADLAYKSVAVNLSDLAAMGATPAWVSLALTLPNVDTTWLAAFSQSLFDILDRYQVALIGGDTTKGNLSVTLTAQGVLPQGKGLFRHKAKIGDRIYVSGCLGDSAAGLDLLLHYPDITYSPSQQYLLQRHLRPTPQVELGQLLLDYSSCAIDISDGLLADLGHILKRSRCSAEIHLDKLPLSKALQENYSATQAEQFALSGGEDYELCFTVAEVQAPAFEEKLAALGMHAYCIGQITGGTDALQLLKHGQPVLPPRQIGFDHFG